VPGATYFVTACLEGSIPAQGLLDIQQYRKELENAKRPPDLNPGQWDLHQQKLLFARTDHWLDGEPAVQHLKQEALATEVRNAIYHFAGERYDVIAWVVMSSHYHWLLRPRDEWVAGLGLTAKESTPRQRIMHSINRHSARQCNKLLTHEGAFWQNETYDHYVRDDGELERIIDYIEMNPVKAGLCERPEEYRFSSAFDRKQLGIPKGEPLSGAGL
jgi:type I restriction enzyme R subunit